MSKCVIIAPLYRGEEREWLACGEGDLLLCADGGYEAAVRAGLRPDLVIGDFDSMPRSGVRDVPVTEAPAHKDDTDMLLCLREGRKRGYRAFLMAGCIGGRADHMLANLQCLYDCALRGEEAWMCDAQNRVRVLTPGNYRFPRMPGRKLSLLAFTPEVRGVRLSGTEWPLRDAVLTARYPLGCSNEIIAEAAELSFTEGALTVIYSRDRIKEDDV